MSKSSVYRDLHRQLGDTKGPKPHWPIMLRQLLAVEFVRQQSELTAYKGKVPIKRTISNLADVGVPEEKAVRRLIDNCEKSHDSILTIRDESFLLLGWQWPNQGSAKGRRADFVGVNTSGGLVVFEAKLRNGETPFMAMLEGLDYLVHFVLEDNFSQIKKFYETRRDESTAELPFPPKAFARTKLSLSAPHEVIVLGSADYYRTHTNSGKKAGRGHGWEEFAGPASAGPFEFQLRFAETDFSGATAKWV